MTRRYLRLAAVVLGLLSLLACLWPDLRNRQTAEERHTVVDVGLPFSPWLHLEDYKMERRLPNGSFQSGFNRSWNVQFVSWSLLMPVLSLVLFWLARRMRPAPQAASTEIKNDRPATPRSGPQP